MLPQGFHWDNALKLGKETAALTALVWPNYLVLESDLPEPGLKFEISQKEFIRRFPVWGIRHDKDRKLVAFANAIQIFADLSAEKLPDAGWSYAIRSGATNQAPNCLCLVIANVDPDTRGFGFAQTLINRAKQATTELGFDTMIAPVRPTLKHQLPSLPMSDYISKLNERGEIYDPWLKHHVQSGGKIVNICSNSVQIRATLQKWREWTGLPLLTSGEVILKNGLVPLIVDTQNNLGIYREPNVWVRYSL